MAVKGRPGPTPFDLRAQRPSNIRRELADAHRVLGLRLLNTDGRAGHRAEEHVRESGKGSALDRDIARGGILSVSVVADPFRATRRTLSVTIVRSEHETDFNRTLLRYNSGRGGAAVLSVVGLELR